MTKINKPIGDNENSRAKEIRGAKSSKASGRKWSKVDSSSRITPKVKAKLSLEAKTGYPISSKGKTTRYTKNNPPQIVTDKSIASVKKFQDNIHAHINSNRKNLLNDPEEEEFLACLEDPNDLDAVCAEMMDIDDDDDTPMPDAPPYYGPEVLPHLDFSDVPPIVIAKSSIEITPTFPSTIWDPKPATPPKTENVPPAPHEPKWVSPLEKALTPTKTPSNKSEIKTLSPQNAADLAASSYKSRNFKAAYIYYSRLHESNPRERFYLERIGDCLFKLGYPEKAQNIYSKLLKRRPNEPRYKEKLADVFAYRGHIIQAGILYKKLAVHNPSEATRYLAKVDSLKESTFGGNKWPSFKLLIDKVGLKSKNEQLTPKELTFIDRVNRTIFHKQLLMWDLMMQRVDALQGKKVPKDLRVEYLKSATGTRYKVYTGEKYPVLAHFTHLDNAKKILGKELEAKTDRSILTDDSHFWNCQYKVAASVIETNPDHPVSSFYGAGFGGANSRIGVGMILKVPDVHRNILHTYQEDSWTPTAVKSAAGAVAVTGQYSEQTLLQYNAFMHRFQTVASYIYAAFQETEKLDRSLQVRDSLDSIEKIFTSPDNQGLVHKLGSGFWNLLNSVIPILDHPAGELQPIFKEIHELVESTNVTDTQAKGKLIEALAKIESLAEGEAESSKTKQVLQEASDARRELESSDESAPFTESTKLVKTGDMTEPLIIRYLNDMERMAIRLSSSKTPEATVFEKIFHRKMGTGDSVTRELRSIRSAVTELYHNNKDILVKGHQDIPGIFTRVASPRELLSTTKIGSYNEIGIRTHLTSKDVQAAPPDFAGLAIERKTALVNGVLRPEVAQILDLAKQLHWPIILV